VLNGGESFPVEAHTLAVLRLLDPGATREPRP
jgi:hypothetical protein